MSCSMLMHLTGMSLLPTLSQPTSHLVDLASCQSAGHVSVAPVIAVKARWVWSGSQENGCAVLQATHEQGLKWFSEAVQLLPDEAAGPADRRHLEEAAVAASQTSSKSCM